MAQTIEVTADNEGRFIVEILGNKYEIGESMIGEDGVAKLTLYGKEYHVICNSKTQARKKKAIEVEATESKDTTVEVSVDSE